MSGFYGTTSGTAGVGIQQRAKDRRLVARPWRGDFYFWYFDEDAYPAGSAGSGFLNGYWPGSGGLDASGAEWLVPIWHEQPAVNTGAISKRGFSGYTRDVNGVIVAGATVRLFRTSDGQMTCQVVSGTDGWFVLDTPYYPDTHFYTAHKAGVPEIAGASPSNLVPG